MVYTCFEMVRDCRADLPQGWRYFASNYVPLIRRVLVQYTGEADSRIESVLRSLRNPGATLFQSTDPAPEPVFLAKLRQEILAQLPVPSVEASVELTTVAEAFEPLTVIEKQAAWLETMGYDAPATAAMMRISPQTVEKVRARGADLLRGKVDAWSLTMLRRNGIALGR